MTKLSWFILSQAAIPGCLQLSHQVRDTWLRSLHLQKKGKLLFDGGRSPSIIHFPVLVDWWRIDQHRKSWLIDELLMVVMWSTINIHEYWFLFGVNWVIDYLLGKAAYSCFHDMRHCQSGRGSSLLQVVGVLFPSGCLSDPNSEGRHYTSQIEQLLYTQKSREVESRIHRPRIDI